LLIGRILGVSIITTTSNAAPSWIFFITCGVAAYSATTLSPVACSNCGISSLKAPLWAPVASTLTSAACTPEPGANESMHAMIAAAAVREAVRMKAS
jgi:hypothetical protein